MKPSPPTARPGGPRQSAEPRPPRFDRPLPRRRFLVSGATAAAGVLAFPGIVGAETDERLRAVIIGHTGGGDFGHGYDQIFAGLADVDVVAASDPDAAGRAKAIRRSGAQRGYADYHEMLATEKPALVGVAFRHPRRHAEVALAALEAGANLFIEKPLAETLADADRIWQVAAERGAKTVVAHNRRYTADFQLARARIRDGFLGEIREFHIHGKQDARAGGEDLIVLGTHDFDLLRFFFGDPRWCSATVLVHGRDATKSDAHEGREPIRVLGDTIHAQFGFAQNLAVTWTSVSAGDGWNQPRGPREHWSFEVLGTRRILAYQSGVGFAFLDSPYLLHPANDVPWQSLPPADATLFLPHHRNLGLDLVNAVRTGQPTLCSARDGAWAIEMLTGVYQSHLGRTRVSFPLADRRDPLA